MLPPEPPHSLRAGPRPSIPGRPRSPRVFPGATKTSGYEQAMMALPWADVGARHSQPGQVEAGRRSMKSRILPFEPDDHVVDI